MKLRFLFSLSLFITLAHSACWLKENYKNENFADFYVPIVNTLTGARGFYEWCTWFDIK